MKLTFYRGLYWFQESDKTDHVGRVYLLNIMDSSDGIMAFPKDVRTVTGEERTNQMEAINYFRKVQGKAPLDD